MLQLFGFKCKEAIDGSVGVELMDSPYCTKEGCMGWFRGYEAVEHVVKARANPFHLRNGCHIGGDIGRVNKASKAS